MGKDEITMKIVCDNCSTKYSIADEKVRGKVFKIKCKKCGHIIVVKGAEGAEAAPPPAGFDQKETRVFDYSGFDGPGEAVWHLVIDREQVGPLGPQDLAGKWAAGEIDGETYAWKEGMGDWQRLAAIAELAFLQGGGAAPAPAGGGGEAGGLFSGHADSSAAATGKADPADLFAAAAASGEEEGGGDLFGSRAPAGDFAAAPSPMAAAPVSARKSVPKDDLFSGSPGGGGGGGLGMNLADPGGQGGKGMTGQRNENSVLFSLNNLAALASEAPKTSSSAPSPAFQSGGGSEGSGLIDIRAMAAMTLGPKKDEGGGVRATSGAAVDDLPVFSSNSFSAPASGVLLPSVASHQGGSNSRLIIILAGLIGVLVIAAVAIVVVVLKSNKQTQVAVAPTAPVGETAGAGGPGAKPEVPAPAPGGTPATPGGETPPAAAGGGTPPAAETPPAGGTAVATAKPAEDKKPDKKPRDRAPSGDKPTPATREPVEDKKPIKEPPAAKCDEVSCAIDPSLACCSKKGGGGGGGGGGGSKSGGGGSDLPETLGRDDIKNGMATVKGRVAQCNDQYKTPGMVEVKIAINGDGAVTSAQVVGKFAGTPAGACVEKAVKNAKFKKWAGPSLSVKYPFQFQ